MADEGAETPTVLPNFDFYFILQIAASDISNQHETIFSNSDFLTFIKVINDPTLDPHNFSAPSHGLSTVQTRDGRPTP